MDPDFSFPKIAAPYAQVDDQTSTPSDNKMQPLLSSNVIGFTLQELLDLRQKQRSGPQLVQEIRKQADDVPYQTLICFLLTMSCFKILSNKYH